MLFFLYQKLSNAVFFYDNAHSSELSNVVHGVMSCIMSVYAKCVVSKQESSLIFLKCDKRTYADAMTLKKCSAYNRKN